jgi:beta-glucosidase
MTVQATYHFPRGFLWGTATAAHQVEGNNINNQWWKWEQEGHTKGTSGLAADWWGGRWKEDFDRAAEGGQNAHRMSVEWSRIQPTPDTWDEDALERYRAMLRGLRDRGMTSLITLHHFSDPLWFYEMNGWENEQSPALFEKFVRKTVEALKEYCTLWCTINEPNVYALLGYVVGDLQSIADSMSQPVMATCCVDTREPIEPSTKSNRVAWICVSTTSHAHKTSVNPSDVLLRNLHTTANMAFLRR